MMDKAALIEELASREHSRVHDRGVPAPDIEGIVAQWERRIATPYADLSEAEKQSDRDRVDRYWPLVVDFVAGWINDNTTPDGDHYGELNAEQWRLEMTR